MLRSCTEMTVAREQLKSHLKTHLFQIVWTGWTSHIAWKKGFFEFLGFLVRLMFAFLRAGAMNRPHDNNYPYNCIYHPFSHSGGSGTFPCNGSSIRSFVLFVHIVSNWSMLRPGTQMKSIFEGQSFKTRPLRAKRRVIWVAGIHISRWWFQYVLGIWLMFLKWVETTN